MITEAHWEKIGKFPHHGIALPLFSLRSENSFGIGEFLDLIPLIDWCKEVGFDLIQLLPINDSGSDPSPYNPLSSCALDPIYLTVRELGLKLPKVEKIEPRVVRSVVLKEKMELLLALFEKTFEKTSALEAYQSFLAAHPWLKVYSEFKSLKQQFSDKHWQDWPKEEKADPHLCHFYTFLQFHSFRQMEMVKDHAKAKGIKLKGDIPILLSPDSADVWGEPNLFDLTLSAGAPPDYYQKEGQYWGFPLFQWEEMKKEGYKWWKIRLKTIEKLFDIYRIDHVVGFFRIWGIPRGETALKGGFIPKDQTLWETLGRERLELFVHASPLLPMAEDLGTIPDEVYPVLKELGICGTKVMRWEKTAKGYIPLNEYEPLSLTTLSSHDTDPFELWWKKAPGEVVSFAELLHLTYHPVLSQNDRLTILHGAHHTSSLFHINLLQEYLALFPDLVALNPENERINRPGTQLTTNWTYRFRPSVEEITSHSELKVLIRKILSPNLIPL